MLIDTLDLPDELLTALEDKKLVIFAGAGVSIPPPSSLPDFERLVEGILGRELEKNEKGQLDRVLGWASYSGIQVHRLAADQLSVSVSKANSLHQSLVQLFGSAEDLKIVTTNFDRHFEEAVTDHFGEGTVDIYTAPALPLGSAFSGLVFLHGAIGRSPEQLVLTDADFGSAYLVEGWAGRFIVDLFRDYTVLFVGYSYDDTVMNYLTRGLAPTIGPNRFALTKKGQREKWNLLGIHAIEYDSANDHRSLPQGLKQWVEYERRGFLDWSRRLQELVVREPEALAPDEQGELHFCLKSPKRARLFYKHATGAGWLRWANQYGWLQPLFSTVEDQEALRGRAEWFAEDPLGERGREALKIALKIQGVAGNALAILATQQVNFALSKLKEGLNVEQAQRAAGWASLIIERSISPNVLLLLESWLGYISPQKYPQLVVQILVYLLRCPPQFSEQYSSGQSGGLGLLVDTPGRTKNLWHHWRKLRKHIAVLAPPLVPVIAEILESRWRWLVALIGAEPNWAPWCCGRNWVEYPPGVGSRSTFEGRQPGLILDIGKDVMDELLASAPIQAAAVIEQWLSASAPQLNQLGLYGLSKSTQWKATQKLERLLENFLPVERSLKVEVYRVLRASYSELGSRQRSDFLKRLEGLYRASIDSSPDQDYHQSQAYQWFNLLVWLERSAPGGRVLANLIKAVRKDYPEFQEREHPELDLRIVDLSSHPVESRLAADEIAQLSFAEWGKEIEDAAEGERGRLGGGVQATLEESARAASSHIEWGLVLTQALVDAEQLKHPVWPKVLLAWAERTFKPAEWDNVLKVLENPDLCEAQVESIAHLVLARARQEDPEATIEMLLGTLHLAELLFPRAADVRCLTSSYEKDWLMEAINHPGGKLAEFLILTISKIVGLKPQKDCGIPSPCTKLLESILSGNTIAAEMGRLLLASRLHYFLWIDSDWTRSRLLPLFDWERDSRQAIQAWDGFLSWGRPNAELLDYLSRFAGQLASNLSMMTKRELYGQFIAHSAFALSDDPLTKEWFDQFLVRAEDPDRAQFAWKVGDLLERIDLGQRTVVWDAWLKRYLEHRTQVPPAPEGEEFSAVQSWLFALPGHLAELVDLIVTLPGTGNEDHVLLQKLEDGELADSDPDLLAQLVLAVASRQEIPSWNLWLLEEVIRRLIGEGARDNLVQKLIEKYVEDGGVKEAELLKLLEESR